MGCPRSSATASSQDARIGVKADGREQARLAIAQDLARAADFEMCVAT